MVGARTKENFETIKPYLECMGKNIVHAGDIGHGLVRTIINFNLLFNKKFLRLGYLCFFFLLLLLL